jgi:Leucine carboxyl methyltransferase
MIDAAITHVSDTALWVAACRATEAERVDAAFHDPLASVLVGERGREIARSFPRSASVAWGVVVRTSAIDRLIGEAVQAGTDTVLNLGAGLDTRPYRMNLPAHLRWIELDYPNIVELKNTRPLEHKAICSVERAVRPQYHWTDQKIHVHTFCYLLALLLGRVVEFQARQLDYTEGLSGLLALLGTVRLAMVLKPAGKHGGRPRCGWMLEHTEPDAMRLFRHLVPAQPPFMYT